MNNYLFTKVKKHLELISSLDDNIHAWEEVFRESVIKRAEYLDSKKIKGTLHGLVRVC